MCFRILTGRVTSGKVTVGTALKAMTPESKEIEQAKVIKLIARSGLERVIMDEAAAGDIIGIAGFTTATVTSTLSDPSITTAIPTTPIDPPVISMTFLPNSSPLSGNVVAVSELHHLFFANKCVVMLFSPFAMLTCTCLCLCCCTGKEGKQCTFPMILKRLQKEVESNVSLVLKQDSEKKEAIEVAGRGELQLGILIENMRREGFEFAVSPPKVVFKVIIIDCCSGRFAVWYFLSLFVLGFFRSRKTSATCIVVSFFLCLFIISDFLF